MADLELSAFSRGVVNVASVPQRSPFRYPGGKTWLIPYVRMWLASRQPRASTIVEPFAGGGIVTLTAVAEGYVQRGLMCELDDDIAAVWTAVLNGKGRWLADRISAFDLNSATVQQLMAETDDSVEEVAFRTIVRNRISRGGILAPGAGVVKNGENGRGIMSRWYPHTLRSRILGIVGMKDRIDFLHGDGLSAMRDRNQDATAVFFIDPPYVVAGRRLYTHSSVDHAEVFRIADSLVGDFLMTYDDTPEIVALAAQHGFAVDRVPMKSTHHSRKMELLISRDLGWLPS